MKDSYITSLIPNEIVTTQFLVVQKDIRQKKTGEPYLSLQLVDRTGEIDAKMWDNVAEVMETFDKDDFIKVKGITQVYQNRNQFTIHRLRLIDDAEVDFADYFPCSKRDPEEMFQELRTIIDGLQNQHLQALLNEIFGDESLVASYKRAPAAKSFHHAYRGGLIEHVLSLCQLCRATAAHYTYLDLDLLLTGAILHDLGKVSELTYERSFGYSAKGQLLGHIMIGIRMIGDAASRISSFPSRLRTLIEHLVLSHHGELEFGSPKIPMFPEALMLHYLDNMDSKMEAMRVALDREASFDTEFTSHIRCLDRSVLKKDKYLSEIDSRQTEPVSKSEHFEPVEPKVELPSQLPLAPAIPVAAIVAKSLPERPAAAPQKASKPATNTVLGEKLAEWLKS